MRKPMHLTEGHVPGDAEGRLNPRGRIEMTHRFQLATCLVAALACSACSTKPRTFSATVKPAAASLAVNQDEAQSFATCDQLVRKGHTSNFASAAASGAAGGAAMFGGAAAVAASGTVGIGATGAGYAMTAAIPFIGLAAGFGMNRMIRSGREKKYRKNMGLCLSELGYDVVDWTRMKKKQPGTATLAPPAPAEPINPEPVPEVTLTAA